MIKLKSSLYGYHKESVKKHIKQLREEHEKKKQLLENEYRELQTDIENLKKSIQSKREGGQDT